MNSSFAESVESADGSAIAQDAGNSYSKEFQSAGQKWQNYVSDISKGILIIVVGGLVGGILISLVSRRER